MSMENQSFKNEIRKKLLQKRKSITDVRRKEAAKNLRKRVADLSDNFNYVASFVSFSSEIDTSLLNQLFWERNQLLLPRSDGDLVFYRVLNMNELTLSDNGIWEPNSYPTNFIPPEKIDLIIVPGIGFDESCHRIGYGKGFYDRFLPLLSCKKIGVAFREQQISLLPKEAHDFPLDEILYF